MNEAEAVNPMHVALVIEQYDPRGGGAERSTAQIAEKLAQRGHRVTVLTGYAPSEVATNGVTIEAMSPRHSSSALRELRFARWAGQRLNSGAFDTSLSLTTAVPARVVQPRAGIVREFQQRSVARRRGLAARWTKQALLWLSPKQWVLRRLESGTLRHEGVRRFVAISRYIAEQARRNDRVSPQKIEVIANAADMPAPSTRQRRQARRALREVLGIADRTTAFLFPANDPWRKGVRPLFEAVRRLRDEDMDLVLLVTGCFSYKLNRLAAEMGVRPAVRWLGVTGNMAEVYAAADATVLPSYYDPSSKVVIESLMMGAPAITTVYNGASDFVVNPDGEDRGRVIADPDDVAALAEAMRDLTDVKKRARCRAAIKDIRHELTMRRHVDELERVLAESVD